jgi:predicted transporter
MKGSMWLFTGITFFAAISVFSRGYAALMEFFKLPTTTGLFSVMLYLVILLFLLSVMGFIMYASERKNGNVKLKNQLFERLLGYDKEAVLPTPKASQDQKETSK